MVLELRRAEGVAAEPEASLAWPASTRCRGAAAAALFGHGGGGSASNNLGGGLVVLSFRAVARENKEGEQGSEGRGGMIGALGSGAVWRRSSDGRGSARARLP
jgi:hypothetical protein